MIEIALLLCAAGSPTLECRETRLQTTFKSIPQCQTFSMHDLAEYMSSHPSLQVKKWKCRYKPDFEKA